MMDREGHMSSKQPSTSTSTQTSNTIQLTPPRREQPSTTTTTMVSNSGPGPTTSSTRRGQSFTGSLGKSGSIVSPSQEEHDSFTHQSRYVSIGKSRGAIFSSIDPGGIHA